MKQLALVVPCYNEAEVLRETHTRLLEIVSQLIEAGRISSDSLIYFVDDGSADTTWSLIEELSATHAHTAGIKLSRNCGHQRVP